MVFCLRYQLLKNPDVSIATKSLPLYSKPKEQLIKQKNKIASNHTIKRRQHQSLIKENKSIYLCTQLKKRENLPTLKNLPSNKLRGGMDYRHKISNYGLAGLFLQLNTCLQSYIHLHHPEEVE